MTLLRNMIRRKGFTLIELLVVIAIIALLAAILTPAINTALLRGRITNMTGNGRGIYTEMFAASLANPLQLAAVTVFEWPQSTDTPAWADSTDYFATIVTNQEFTLSYNIFAGPGIKPATDESQFIDGELRNAWCIALDVSDKMDGSAPVMFTQNIILTAKKLDGFNGLNVDEQPFGNKAGVIVTRSGSAFFLDQNTALATNFNAVGAVNEVLYPKNGQTL